MMKPKWLYVGAVAAALLQSGVLYAGIERRASILRSGREIVLQTEPVDPRDLMRGDYVALGYDISSVMRKDIAGKPEGDSRTVYVAVKPDANGIWRFSRAAFRPFDDLAADEVQLRGRSAYPISDETDAKIWLTFGIERYYVPEGQGHPIEDSERAHRITAVVAVNAAGTAVLKALREDGRQLYEEPLY
ncbi:MAG: hypothetical protein BGP07_03100 [Rhizobiales bacterium 63-22]|nr:MAG: hypothetical protein BGP07_03100 [Rhizobiales bacterium 63-22]